MWPGGRNVRFRGKITIDMPVAPVIFSSSTMSHATEDAVGRVRGDSMTDAGARPRRLRWLMIGMAFLATVINYLDRQTLSVVAPILREQFHKRFSECPSGAHDSGFQLSRLRRAAR